MFSFDLSDVRNKIISEFSPRRNASLAKLRVKYNFLIGFAPQEWENPREKRAPKGDNTSLRAYINGCNIEKMCIFFFFVSWFYFRRDILIRTGFSVGRFASLHSIDTGRS